MSSSGQDNFGALSFMTLFDHPMTRAAISGLVLAAILLVMVLVAPDVLLMLFASLLVATLLHGAGDWISQKTGMPYGFALMIFTVAILAGFALLVAVAAPVLVEQGGQLLEQLPRALEGLRARIQKLSWGPLFLRQISMETLTSSPSAGTALAGRATTAVTSTFGALGNFAIICVIGVFLATDPPTYRAGLLALIAPSGRSRAAEVLARLTRTLRSWMLAQLLSMAVIGLLTTLGLWLLGVPLAIVLGVIAALLTFIPNFGPILAAAPAILLGLAESPLQGGYVAVLYVIVQIIEGNVTTPLIQQHSIALPPALILLSQVLMAELSGLLGLALATPLAAVAITLTRALYVEGFLHDRPEANQCILISPEASPDSSPGSPDTSALKD